MQPPAANAALAQHGPLHPPAAIDPHHSNHVSHGPQQAHPHLHPPSTTPTSAGHGPVGGAGGGTVVGRTRSTGGAGVFGGLLDNAITLQAAPAPASRAAGGAGHKAGGVCLSMVFQVSCWGRCLMLGGFGKAT
jgi:hypothetical protein